MRQNPTTKYEAFERGLASYKRENSILEGFLRDILAHPEATQSIRELAAVGLSSIGGAGIEAREAEDYIRDYHKAADNIERARNLKRLERGYNGPMVDNKSSLTDLDIERIQAEIEAGPSAEDDLEYQEWKKNFG